jgi:hypothetical protein
LILGRRRRANHGTTFETSLKRIKTMPSTIRAWSHVTASVKKLLSRIVQVDQGNGLERNSEHDAVNLVDLAEHSYGIALDPSTQFAVVKCSNLQKVGRRAKQCRDRLGDVVVRRL